jgi:hypothetical protein
MPGMNSGLNIHDPLVVSSFHAALLHQGLIALAIFALLSIGWVAVRGPGAPGETPAGQMLGVHNPHVELVAVNVNPLYHQAAYIQAFDQQEHLASAPDWEYLTGDPATLRTIYKEYGVPAETLPAGAMLGHNDTAYVISPSGEITQQLDLDPGPGTAATESSFATELAEAANKTLAAS